MADRKPSHCTTTPALAARRRPHDHHRIPGRGDADRNVSVGTASVTHNLAMELRRAVRGEVRFDAVSRALYSTDASIYEIEPIGVVIPRDADDVQAVLEVTRRAG